jgi:hypothetical protein
LLRYQELAVENYGCASECLANERISCVKNLGNFFLECTGIEPIVNISTQTAGSVTTLPLF